MFQTAEEELAVYKPNIDELCETMQKVRQYYDGGAESEVSELTHHYEELVSQVYEQAAHAQHAVAVRQHYHTNMAQLMQTLSQLTQQIDAGHLQQVSLPAKVDTYKVNSWALSGEGKILPADNSYIAPVSWIDLYIMLNKLICHASQYDRRGIGIASVHRCMHVSVDHDALLAQYSPKD